MHTWKTIIPALPALLIVVGCNVHLPPVGGILYSDCNLPAVWATATPNGACDFSHGPRYEKLGKTVGKATSTSILGLVWTGDSGAGTAYQQALRSKQADAILSPKIDYRGKGLLGLYATITVIVEGEAIKFVE